MSPPTGTMTGRFSNDDLPVNSINVGSVHVSCLLEEESQFLLYRSNFPHCNYSPQRKTSPHLV